MAFRKQQIMLSVLTVVHLLLDFAGISLLRFNADSMEWAYFLQGVWLGQILCLTVWCAWGNGAWRFRIPRAVWLLVLSNLAVLAGISSTERDLNKLIMLGMLSTLQFGLSFAALALIRELWKLSLTSLAPPAAHVQRQQFTILSIMLWTARIGVALAISRWAFREMSWETDPGPFFIEMLMIACVTSAIATAIGILAAFVALAPTTRSILWTIVVTGTLIIVMNISGREFTNDIVLGIANASSSLGLGVAAVVIPTLWMLRACGYRLEQDK